MAQADGCGADEDDQSGSTALPTRPKVFGDRSGARMSEPSREQVGIDDPIVAGLDPSPSSRVIAGGSATSLTIDTSRGTTTNEGGSRTRRTCEGFLHRPVVGEVDEVTSPT